MKKSLKIAGVLMVSALSLSTAVFAEDKSATVNYEVPEAYTWSVSSSVNVGGTLTVSVDSVNSAGHNVDVLLTNSANGFKVVNASNIEAAYAVKDGDNTLSANSSVITDATEETQKVLNVEFTSGAPTAAGTYTDTLTFTASMN